MESAVDAEPHPLDVAVEIQTGLLQLYLDRPMANAVEVADADALAFQVLQRLDMRRRHPDIGVLVAPAAQNVEIGTARALVENRARLNVEPDVDGFFFHRLRHAALSEAQWHHR